jgi:hypothetical protein
MLNFLKAVWNICLRGQHPAPTLHESRDLGDVLQIQTEECPLKLDEPKYFGNFSIHKTSIIEKRGYFYKKEADRRFGYKLRVNRLKTILTDSSRAVFLKLWSVAVYEMIRSIT